MKSPNSSSQPFYFVSVKNILFLLVALFLTIFCMEILSFLGLAVIRKDFDVWSAIHEQQVKTLGAPADMQPLTGEAGSVGAERVHPYFGYVMRTNTPTDRFGFENTLSPLQKKAPGKVILAVLGGSVAEEMFHAAIQDLVEELKKSPKFRDQEIVPVCLALGGYKQPQQMILMNYFTAVGGEFDMVVNLDGFNEVTMPIMDNRPAKVSAGFPRNWRIHANPLEPWAVKPVMMIRVLSALRHWTAKTFLAPPLSMSYSSMALWKFLNYLLYRGIYHYHQQYLEVLPKEELEKLGPYRDFKSPEDMRAFVADLWMLGSKNIALLAPEYGFKYYHFLQPNLFLEGTKEWSAKEESYRNGGSPYPEFVRGGYPELQKRGAQLARDGIRFFDLTRVFEKNRETLYADDCCHLRSQGGQVLARAIGKIIAEDFEKNPIQLKTL